MLPPARLALLALLLASPSLTAADSSHAPGCDPSLWRGFNLLEKFTLRGDAPYREDDFRWIAGFGFNFVRLPVDYRCYTEPGDWLAFRETALRQIDEAVAFATRYDLHVALNLHRAPGFCINPPAEPRDLWTDPVAESAFIAHWAMFARRYRNVPPERLSFNLLNEPRTTHDAFVRVHRAAIAAIHAIDPQRPVLVDGNHAGRDPAPELLDVPNVIQSTRGYHPMGVSHFRAGWIRDADTWPLPLWPPSRLAGHLYGPAKPALRSPLVLRGPLPAGTEISLALGELSSRAKLQARSEHGTLTEALYDPRREPQSWEVSRREAAWAFHRPVAPLQFQVRLTQGTAEVAIENVDGDWVRFEHLSVRLPGKEPRVLAADPTWGIRQVAHRIGPDGTPAPLVPAPSNALLAAYLEPWREIARRGEAVFVGEWGCYHRTPHGVALAWMEDWLELWREAGLGWALWNFRGSFGILDSGRTDVAYEEWNGHKLDRAMLELLQRYAAPQPGLKPGAPPRRASGAARGP